MKIQFVLAGILVFTCKASLFAVDAGLDKTERSFTNSVGMELARIEPGQFRMGQLKKLEPEVLPVIEGGDRGGRFDLLAEGDYDEKPVHTVKITKPFYMGVYEVTNKQYELFDPEHKKLRGKHGLSQEDDEAVIHVNWYEAQAFCRWLCDKEGVPYRLPNDVPGEVNNYRAICQTNHLLLK